MNQHQHQQQHQQQHFMQPPPHHLQQGPGGHAHPMQHPQSPGMPGFPPSGFSPQHHHNLPPQHQQPMPPMQLPHHPQGAVMMGMPLSPEQHMSVAMAQMGIAGMAPGMGPVGQIGGLPPPPGLMQDPMGGPGGIMMPPQAPPGLGGLPIGHSPPPRPPSSTPYRPPLARTPGSPSQGSFQPAPPADQQWQVTPAGSRPAVPIPAFLPQSNTIPCAKLFFFSRLIALLNPLRDASVCTGPN